MRLLNRLLALLLALALLAVSVILIAEVIAHAVNAKAVIVDWPAWQRWAERTHWNRAVVKVWSIVLIVIGALVLGAQLKPRRVTRLDLVSDDPVTDAAVTRSGVAGAVNSAVSDVDGVSDTTTTVTSRKVRIRARSEASDPAAAQALAGPVSQAAQGRLADLGLRRPPALDVHVTTRSR